MTQFSRKKIISQKSGSGGGGGATIDVVTDYASLPAANTVSGEFRWVSNSTGVYLTGLYYSNGVSWEFNPADDIIVVANYSALPAANTVSGKFYWCSASQGTSWLPGSFGGTYYSAGLYYSNGTTWEFLSVPYQATQAEVDAGTNTDKFLTPSTFQNSTQLNSKADKVDGLTSGGAITIGTFGANNVRVAAATWFISPSNYSTVIDTDFSVALAAAGLQRYVGFYGNTSNAIVKVEGTESEYAALPTQPANTAVIGYILVTDASAGAAPDLSAYATIDPRVLTITSSATPTIDASLYDIVNMTALATNITSMTSGLSGVTGNFKDLIINFKDNGVARTITWGAKFTSLYATLPTTTIIGKNLAVGLRYNTSTNVYNCWVYSYSI